MFRKLFGFGLAINFIATTFLATLLMLSVSPQKSKAIECNGTLTTEDCPLTDVGAKITGPYQMEIAAVGLYPNDSSDSVNMTIPSCSAGSPTIVRASAYWTFRDQDTNYWDESVDIAVDANPATTVTSDRRYKTAPTVSGNLIYSSYVADITSDGIIQEGTHTYTMSGLDTSVAPASPFLIALWGFGLHVIYSCPEFTTVTIQQKEGQDMHWYGFGDTWSLDRSELICESFTASASPRTISLHMFLPGSADTVTREADIWYVTGTGSTPLPTAYDLLTDVVTPANGGLVLDRAIFQGQPELEGYENTLTLPAGHEFLCIQLDSSFQLGEHPDDTNIHGASMFAGAGWFSYEPAATPPTTVSLGNLVWNDVNNNGLKDTAESGICNVTVQLFNDTNADGLYDPGVEGTTPVGTQTTGCGVSAGEYLFTGLTPGEYLVVIPASQFGSGQTLNGYQSSSGTNNSTAGAYEPASDPDNNTNEDDNGSNTSNGHVVAQAITLAVDTEPTNDGDSDNDTNLTVDFGFYMSACLGNFVWNDVNNNGRQDSGEVGVGGVTATLYDASDDSEIAEMETASDGYYLFCNLAPGDYFVMFSDLPENYGFVEKDAVDGDDATDSDASTSNGQTDDYSLAAGDSEMDVDAGIHEGATPPTSTSVNSSASAPDTGLMGILHSAWGSILSAVVVATTVLGYRFHSVTISRR